MPKVSGAVLSEVQEALRQYREEVATLMGLRDQLELFEKRIAALEPTPTTGQQPPATPTP